MNALPLLYVMFLAALSQRGASLVPNGALSPAGVASLRLAAFQLAKTFLKSAQSGLGSETDRSKALVRELSRIVSENVAQEMKRRVNKEESPANQRGIFSLLQAMRASQPEHFYEARDRAGRTWKAVRLVEFLVRDYEYQSKIDELISAAKDEGVQTVEITNPDPKSQFAGAVMSLDEMTARRTEIFHPNSRSSFKAHAVSP